MTAKIWIMLGLQGDGIYAATKIREEEAAKSNGWFVGFKVQILGRWDHAEAEDRGNNGDHWLRLGPAIFQIIFLTPGINVITEASKKLPTTPKGATTKNFNTGSTPQFLIESERAISTRGWKIYTANAQRDSLPIKNDDLFQNFLPYVNNATMIEKPSNCSQTEYSSCCQCNPPVNQACGVLANFWITEITRRNNSSRGA